jgi:hypothetical protein
MLAMLILLLVSCNYDRKQAEPTPAVPKALEDKSSSFELVSKRGYDDLVENLYNDLADKDVELKKLEDKIDELDKSRYDSTSVFNKFNEKSQSYFSSADRHAAEIKDSLLRDKMRTLLENNLARYNSSVIKHNDLLKVIEARGLTISDLHTVLKIVKTLPLIEKYQKDNLPGTKSLEGYIKQQDETIKLADTLIKN